MVFKNKQGEKSERLDKYMLSITAAIICNNGYKEGGET